MKVVILIVIASVHLTGSYFDQSRLSSALMQFEGTLEFPREKQVDESAPGTGLSTVLGTVTPATSPAAAPGLSTSLETASPTTEVTVMDRETIATSENSASTSPRTVSTEANSVVITSESSASTSPRSVSTKASPEVITTQSPASASYSSPGSTTTMTSALTTKMLPVKSSAVWSTKDMMMTLHLGTVLWLLILSGGAMCVGGTLSLFWVRLGALQDQRARFAPPAPSVNV